MLPLLHQAAYDGDLEAVQQLLQQPGASANQTTDNGTVPLHYAAMDSHTDVINALIGAGAAVDVPNQAGVTPLQYAILNSHFAAIAALLRHGANPNTTLQGNRHPLFMAVFLESPQIARLLLNAGADPNYQSEVMTPLAAAIFESQYEIITACVEAGGNLGPNASGKTPLAYALHQHDARCVRTLLDAGADVNFQNYIHDYIWCLPYSENASMAVLYTLLSAGADVLQTNAHGQTPLQYIFNEIDVFARRDRLHMLYEATVALVAAGDRNWVCVPAPCPGLERALSAVHEAAPDELSQLFTRLEPAVQSRIRTGLLAVHRAATLAGIVLPPSCTSTSSSRPCSDFT